MLRTFWEYFAKYQKDFKLEDREFVRREQNLKADEIEEASKYSVNLKLKYLNSHKWIRLIFMNIYKPEIHLLVSLQQLYLIYKCDESDNMISSTFSKLSNTLTFTSFLQCNILYRSVFSKMSKDFWRIHRKTWNFLS